MIRLFAGFDEAGAVGRCQREAVLNDGEGSDAWGVLRVACSELLQPEDLPIQQQTLVALLGNQCQGFLQRKLLRKRQLERNQRFGLRTSSLH